MHLQPYWQVEVCPLRDTNICADVEIPLSLSDPGAVWSPKLLSCWSPSARNPENSLSDYFITKKPEFWFPIQTEKVTTTQETQKLRWLIICRRQYNHHRTASILTQENVKWRWLYPITAPSSWCMQNREIEDNERLMSKSLPMNIWRGEVCLIHDHPVKGFLYMPPPHSPIQRGCLLDFQADGIFIALLSNEPLS